MSWLVQLVPSLFVAFLVWICLKQGIIFSFFVATSTHIGFAALHLYALRALPQSFTIGEAAVVVQAIILHWLNVYVSFTTTTNFWDNGHIINAMSPQQQVGHVVQLTLLGVAVIVAVTKLVNAGSGLTFYIVVGIVGAAVMACPIQNDRALLVLIEFVFGDWERVSREFHFFGCAAQKLIHSQTHTDVHDIRSARLNRNDRLGGLLVCGRTRCLVNTHS